MLITSNHRSSSNLNDVTFTVLELPHYSCLLLNNETTQTPKISNDYIQKQCRQVSKNKKLINMNSGTLTLPQTSEGICVHWIHSLFISTFFMDFRGNYC